MYFFLLINPVQNWSKDPMQKCIQLNYKKERRRKKTILSSYHPVKGTRRQELLYALVDVMLTWFEMHQEFPNLIRRCLRFHH